MRVQGERRRSGHVIACTAVLIAGLSALAGGCSEDPALARTQAVIDDLVVQDFGAASSRFRMYEDEVLSVAAAPVWRRALTHDDTTVREWAVDALARIGEAEDVPRLVERLDDRSRGVRLQALVGLTQLDAMAARVAFAELLSSDRPRQVVLGAQGMSELLELDAVPLILERFSDPSLPASTRGALTQTLAVLGDPAAAAALLQVAVDEELEPQLRRLAAEAIVVLEGPGVREAVQQLATLEDPYIKNLAQQAIASGEFQ